MPVPRLAGWLACQSALIATSSAVGSAAAQTLPSAAPIAVPPVTITATRVPTPENEVGSSVTVITSEQIEQKQQPTLPDVLRDVPGLNVVQSGGPGGQTSVFMRGTNANHVKVLVDGIDVSDPSSPSDSFDFTHLLTGDIERVEVLRGPQSGLYGSDAIGGVISITTKSGSGPPKFVGRIEGGSFTTFNQGGLVSGSLDRFSYAFDVEHFHSGNTPVTPLSLLPPGRQRIDDRYDNLTVGTKLGLALGGGADLGVVVRHIDTSLNFTGDDFSTFPSTPAAARSRSTTEQLYSRGTYHQSLLDGAFDYTLGLGYSDHRGRDSGPDIATTDTHGDRVKFDGIANWRFLPGETLTVGVEHQRDEIRNSPISAQITDDAGFAQLQSAFFGRLFNTVSVRYDGNDRFGGETTYRIAPAILVPETGTRLKGSVGTGFKAPTLNELFVDFPAFGFFANPNLKPETSFGYDAGFEQTLPGQPFSFGATWFHNDIDNLITSNAAFTTYINVGRAVTKGVEAFAEWRPWQPLLLRTDYTFTLANDAILKTELLRRPRHKLSATATWQATEVLSLTATVNHLSDWADIDRSGSTGVRAGGYTIVNFTTSFDLGGGASLFGRINNLFDRTYQDPTGFQRPGMGVFGGLKISLGGASP